MLEFTLEAILFYVQLLCIRKKQTDTTEYHYCMAKYIFIFLVIISSLNAQNLVPNPSFEVLIDCPENYVATWNTSMIELASPWKVVKGRPYYLHECAKSVELIPPNFGHLGSYFGYKYPRTGKAMLALDISWTRDYAGVELNSQLEKDKTYYVEFYVSPRFSTLQKDSIIGDRFCFTDAIGIYFSDSVLSNEGDYSSDHDYRLLVLDYEPQIEHRGEVINYWEGYTRICRSYKAKGGEKFITIGNFRFDYETNFELDFRRSWPQHNKLFIDDIRIIEIEMVPEEILLCKNEILTLDVNFEDSEILWNDGTQGQNIIISEAGTYIVTANNGDCILSDTIIVQKIEENSSNTTEFNYESCQNEIELEISSQLKGNYYWNDGSTSPSITAFTEGEYVVTVENKCGSFTEIHKIELVECDCNVFIPDAFSPNGDGVNDEFEIFSSCEDSTIEKAELRIFDRWGGLIFSTYDITYKWDGTKNGAKLDNGEYVYMLSVSLRIKGQNELIDKKYSGSVLKL